MVICIMMVDTVTVMVVIVMVIGMVAVMVTQ
jgi:hypothetical protein